MRNLLTICVSLIVVTAFAAEPQFHVTVIESPPSFTVTVVKPAANVAEPLTSHPHATGLHHHRCPQCGTRWQHGIDANDSKAAHTCHKCGIVVWELDTPVAAALPVEIPRSSGSTTASRAGVSFGQPWVETGTGRTSVEHLMREHGYTREQLAPYVGNQDALNRIHGAAHTHDPKPVKSVLLLPGKSNCHGGVCPVPTLRRR